jgi:4-hydroxybenzoyl-CoA thioesterase
MFAITQPLRFGDCDPSGIAYYPSYLRMLDGAVEDFFESLGAPRREMIEFRRIGTPTVTLDLVFRKPGLQGDQLTFEIRVTALGRASLDLDHSVSAQGDMLWTARQRLVATSLDTHASCAWPDDIRAALSHHLETSHAHNPAT